MSRSVEILSRYYPVHETKDLEQFRLDGIGCIVAIVNWRGLVYVVDELDPTKRGQDLLTEKRRNGEFIQHNVWGALVEEAGVEEDDLPHFWHVRDRVSLIGGTPFPHRDLNIHGDVVLIYYSGDKQKFGSRNEVRGVGFVNPIELRNNGVRPATIPALNLIITKGAIDNLLMHIQMNEGEPVFPPNFNPQAFFNRRQELADLFISQS